MYAPSKTRRRSMRPWGHHLEPLEARINLSATLVAAPAPVTQRYRTASYNYTGAATYGKTYVNPTLTDAQVFFNLFHNNTTPSNPDPAPPPPTPDPNPNPAPPPTFTTDPVSVSQSTLGNFTRLTITGTTGNDSILVTQSGSTITIVANGTTTTVSGNFAELAIYGDAGSDTITVGSSITATSLVYGGAGNNTLTVQSAAKAYIVALGQGSDVLSGTANTSFWADPTDAITGSTAINTNRVSSFYQPYSSVPGNADYISTAPDGANLRDPSDSGATMRLSASLWGTGPTMSDVNQGQTGDCYFLAAIQSLAYSQAALLQEMAVDLGDGTYAVRFNRNGITTYVRVDGDLPTAPWGGLNYAHPAGGGAIWAAIIEKAYAFYRTSAGTYASLNWGWTGSAFNDLGVTTTTFSAGAGSLFTTLTSALAGGKAIAAVTNGTVPSGIPIIGSHAYSIVATSVVGGVQYITVRNPWGFDGAGNDPDPNDALVMVTVSQFASAFSSGSIQS